MINAIAFYNGIEIQKDSEGRISLTDLWKSSGSPNYGKPADWARKDGAGFIEAATQILNMPVGHIIKSKKGKGGGSYAHKQIALAYAKYLSPELHYAVNQVFFERIEEEKNPDLILDRTVDTYKRHGKSDNWIAERLTGKAARIAFTGVLKSHGVEGIGYRACTNGVYSGIFGGDASHVRGKKNLPKKSNTRENMSEIELTVVRLVEQLSAKNIERLNLFGNEACEAECKRTSKLISNSVSQALKQVA